MNSDESKEVRLSKSLRGAFLALVVFLLAGDEIVPLWGEAIYYHRGGGEDWPMLVIRSEDDIEEIKRDEAGYILVVNFCSRNTGSGNSETMSFTLTDILCRSPGFRDGEISSLTVVTCEDEEVTLLSMIEKSRLCLLYAKNDNDRYCFVFLDDEIDLLVD